MTRLLTYLVSQRLAEKQVGRALPDRQYFHNRRLLERFEWRSPVKFRDTLIVIAMSVWLHTDIAWAQFLFSLDALSPKAPGVSPADILQGGPSEECAGQ